MKSAKVLQPSSLRSEQQMVLLSSAHIHICMQALNLVQNVSCIQYASKHITNILHFTWIPALANTCLKSERRGGLMKTL